MLKEINDLRTFLEMLEEHGELEHIDTEVDLEYELGSVIAELEKADLGAGFFHKIKDREYPVCGGLLSSMERISLALGENKEKIKDFISAALKNPLDTVPVDKGICQEVIIKEPDIDLYELPIPTHAPNDAGPYITSGLVHSKSIYGGRQNVSYHRMEVKGKNKLGIFINEWRHLKSLYDEAEKEGIALPIAVVIGADPVHYIAAGLRTEEDEIKIAGALRRKNIEVVKCLNSDILVPATSEIILEGEIIPEYREEEGPLGEFTGHYSRQWMNPIFKVTAITHRNNPIYQTFNGASYEHVAIGNVIPREPVLKEFTEYVSSGIIDIHIPPYGSGFMAVIKIKKKNPGEPKNVAMAAMTSNVNIKNVVIVDPDIDIYDPKDVMWAICNRVNPVTDIFYVPMSQCHELDPSCDARGVVRRWG